MNVEQVNNKKNTVTIIAFILVCIVLNLDSLATLFHFKLPLFISTYASYFPLLFVIVVFTQKKAHTINATDEILWEAKRKNVLHINNSRTIIRYSIIIGLGVLFLTANMYESRSGISSQSGSILIGLLIGVAITLIYGYLKKGFHIGVCDKGILYGYTSKLMLIHWDDIADFELQKNANTIIIYCKRKMTLHKVILNNKEHFESLKDLVTKNLTYKNVTKLLTDD